MGWVTGDDIAALPQEAGVHEVGQQPRALETLPAPPSKKHTIIV